MLELSAELVDRVVERENDLGGARDVVARQCIYREIAIVRDESLWGRNNVYTLQSPLIKTEKRALKVSEAILANLNRYRGLVSGDDIPRTTEIILSFDEPFEEFSRRLTQLSREWEASGLREISH